jgi:hypothetical protein
MIDGIDTDRLRCECGQVLCKDLDIRTGTDGAIVVCPNCGNSARLEEREPSIGEFEEFPLDQAGTTRRQAPAT